MHKFFVQYGNIINAQETFIFTRDAEKFSA